MSEWQPIETAPKDGTRKQKELLDAIRAGCGFVHESFDNRSERSRWHIPQSTYPVDGRTVVSLINKGALVGIGDGYYAPSEPKER